MIYQQTLATFKEKFKQNESMSMRHIGLEC